MIKEMIEFALDTLLTALDLLILCVILLLSSTCTFESWGYGNRKQNFWFFWLLSFVLKEVENFHIEDIKWV